MVNLPLNKMLALYPSNQIFMFRGHFLRRLPAEIRSHLIHKSILDPRALALKADALWQSRALFLVAHVSGNVEEYEAFALGRPGGSSKPKNQFSCQRLYPASRSAPAPQSSSGSDNVYCQYHCKFGNNAHRCFQPCTWSENHSSGMRVYLLYLPVHLEVILSSFKTP